jgi:hypothetical protein
MHKEAGTRKARMVSDVTKPFLTHIFIADIVQFDNEKSDFRREIGDRASVSVSRTNAYHIFIRRRDS